MPHYVALLRGIMPTDPRMLNENLRRVFESLGFSEVTTLQSSGNVLFKTRSASSASLEKRIEEELPKQLGFTRAATVRSREELQALVDKDPFKGLEHAKQTNLNVTFLKSKPSRQLTIPYQPEGKGYSIIYQHGQELCSVIDVSTEKTPDLMSWLEQEFGKEITTRTYPTVLRILARMNQAP